MEKEITYKLSFKHREFARALCKKYITKRYLRKGCKQCNLVGYTGTNERNEVIPCSNCVNISPLAKEWNDYCKTHIELTTYVRKEETDG